MKKHGDEKKVQISRQREYLIIIRDNFLSFCIKTYVVMPHLKRIVETVQMRNHNVWFQ